MCSSSIGLGHNRDDAVGAVLCAPRGGRGRQCGDVDAASLCELRRLGWAITVTMRLVPFCVHNGVIGKWVVSRTMHTCAVFV